MTEPEGTPQDTDLSPESSIDESTADVNPESEGDEGASDYQEEAEKLAAADYQERMEEFDNVESSAPVTSLPTKSSDLDKKDLEV